jgi:hypothetical protein
MLRTIRHVVRIHNIDYRGLNEATEKASWPLPNITQLFDRMSAQRPDTFGVMDLTSGYHQAPLAGSARKFTAFLCFAGLFLKMSSPIPDRRIISTTRHLFCFQCSLKATTVRYTKTLFDENGGNHKDVESIWTNKFLLQMRS